MATRDRTRDELGNWVPFGEPTCLGLPVNTPISELKCSISFDWPAPGSSIFFNRYVPGQRDTFRLYEATWYRD